MDVKEAVSTAREYLSDLYEAEEIADVGLEEVKFDEKSDAWKITIGFSRPWDRKGALAVALRERLQGRSYKVVRIDDHSGRVESLTDRILKTAE